MSMAEPVITKHAAEKLNEKARSISPILFWTCNYEPTYRFAFNEDAAFLLNIHDLYKFCFDTNCILRRVAFSNSFGDHRGLLDRTDANNIKGLAKLIQCLRAVLGHNQSELNGVLHFANAQRSIEWISALLGKDFPNTIEDYDALNNELNRVGKDILYYSNLLLDKIAALQPQDSVINAWTECTLDWYSTATNQEYYRSQVGMYYQAKAVRSGADMFSNSQLRYKTNKWIEKNVGYALEQELKTLRSKEKELRVEIENPNPFALQIKENDPEMYKAAQTIQLEELDRIKDDASSKEETFDRIREVISSQFGGNKSRYFFADLKRQLLETIDSLRKSGEQFTLLPQDLFPIDIERNFIGTPGIEGDF